MAVTCAFFFATAACAEEPLEALPTVTAPASAASGPTTDPWATPLPPPTASVTPADAGSPPKQLHGPKSAAQGCPTLPPEECGKWEIPTLERWRDAMQGYRSGVDPLRERPLLGTQVAFARYLNGMHNRVHPWFADRFLESLDRRPREDVLNDPKLAVRLEVVIASDGRIAQMGVVRSSGLPAFDASGLEAFARAAPFDPTPPEVRSSDGNVWVQWELKRDAIYACSTMNSRPFLLGL